MSNIDEKGLKAAQRLAGWEIGDRYWADRIINAYLHPDETNELLDRNDVPQRTGVYR